MIVSAGRTQVDDVSKLQAAYLAGSKLIVKSISSRSVINPNPRPGFETTLRLQE
jgi:hypothetical protein